MKSVLSSFATISIHIALELEKYLLYSYESILVAMFFWKFQSRNWYFVKTTQIWEVLVYYSII